MSLLPKHLCHAPGCMPKKVTARGLCWKHYREAQERVASGETTWEALCEAGHALPPLLGRNKSERLFKATGSELRSARPSTD